MNTNDSVSPFVHHFHRSHLKSIHIKNTNKLSGNQNDQVAHQL